jgi:exopolysaccharide biosynthesis protein
LDSAAVASDDYDPLSPSRAAFYSAVLPGLGQAYNKKYWKIPIIYGALGTGVYVYDYNSKNYDRARTAFKLRKQGKPDEFDGLNGNIFLSEDALVSAQKTYKKDRDLSLLITVALYVLQILEASTNAHLLQHNVDQNLSLSPKLIKNSMDNRSIVGASINLKF